MTSPSFTAPASPAAALFRRVAAPWRDFAGLNSGATYLWPRWLVLRAVGVVFLFVFSGIIAQGEAFLGPRGIVPLGEFFTQLREMFPGAVDAFIAAPTLFWLNTSAAFIAVLAWAGLFAALALIFNLAPRLALFACWLIFLSFAATWRIFSPAQLDNLMLEVALLCVPFAPAGLRPGLGAHAPPRPLVLFMVRWLLFRVMFESGLVKLVAGDPHWRDFSAMEVTYETSPFPTILGYWDFHLPRAYHVCEILLTFAAELVAPVLAIFAGRRGRWFAFFTWSALQIGIQLTSNFGWLNLASLGLGLLLLDDQMLAAAAARLRLAALAARFIAPAASPAPASPSAPAASPAPLILWRRRALTFALWTHFAFAGFFLCKAAGLLPNPVPGWLAAPVKFISEFRSVNEYSLYAAFDPVRYHVEFEGSNDAGRTWRTYDYRFLPQHPDQIAPFIAPWFARFDATIQIAAWSGRKSRVIPVVASHLLARNRVVMDLFRADPFPDRPPTIIRMRGYRLSFTSLETQRRTGDYWHKEPAGDYLPALYLTPRGEIAECDLAPVDAALQRRDIGTALALLEQQFAVGNVDAGLRLADLYARGLGVARDPARAFALFTDLAARGEVSAAHNLGTCYEYGVGVAPDLSRALDLYRNAADRGYALSLYSLAGLHAQEKITPRDDLAGLVHLLRATARAQGDDPVARYVREDRAGHQRRLLDRMSPADIATARQRAAARR